MLEKIINHVNVFSYIKMVIDTILPTQASACRVYYNLLCSESLNVPLIHRVPHLHHSSLSLTQLQLSFSWRQSKKIISKNFYSPFQVRKTGMVLPSFFSMRPGIQPTPLEVQFPFNKTSGHKTPT